MSVSKSIKEALYRSRDTKKDIKALEKFFKVFPGGYGEGDKFIAVSVPEQRRIAGQFYQHATLKDIEELLKSEIHEHRLTALFILVKKYQKSKRVEEHEQMAILYLNNIERVNGWDLVDSSAHHIIGAYVYETGQFGILDLLAESNHLWKQRVSIIATFYMIRLREFGSTLQISEKLVNHKHDLIHKAVGWMLREVGNRSIKDELTFLDRYAKSMPRTMLRYAIEKFDPALRQSYLNR